MSSNSGPSISGFYLFNITYSTPSGRKFVDNLVLKIPLFGDLILKSELASMSDTLSTLINSGISIVEALEKCKFLNLN